MPATKKELEDAVASRYATSAVVESSLIRAKAKQRHANRRFHIVAIIKAIHSMELDTWLVPDVLAPKIPPIITARGTEYMAKSLVSGGTNSSA
ncbi:MAG: hypothetical protein AABO57_09875 [Acidobacteriota bacterium]